MKRLAFPPARAASALSLITLVSGCATTTPASPPAQMATELRSVLWAGNSVFY